MVKATKIVILGVPILVLGFLLWPRQETMEEASKKIISAVLSGDGKTLLKYSWPRETELLVLSDSKLTRLLHEVVLQNFAGATPVGTVENVTDQQRGFTTATQVMAMPDGRQIPLTVNVVLTGDGPKGTVVAGPLFSSWAAKFYGKSKEVPANARKDVAWLKGIDEQSDKLEHLGLTGVVTLDPKKPLRSWGEYRDRTLFVLKDRGFNPDLLHG